MAFLEHLDNLVLIDFGVVEMKTKHTKLLKVKNENTIDQIYSIERHVSLPKLCSGIEIKPDKSTPVKPGKSFDFAVEFTPKIPNSRSVEYFVVTHKFGIQQTICIKVTTGCPEYSISCSKLKITCPKNEKQCSKKFKIKNNSNSKMPFQFTMDKSCKLLDFNPSYGYIPPLQEIYITVTFKPIKFCKIFQRVFCLVEYLEPTFVDVYGVREEKDDTHFKIATETLPQFKNGYHCFMSNVMDRILAKELPPLSISNHYFDFSHCSLKKQTEQAFAVTNNTDKQVSILWSKLAYNEFEVTPHVQNVSPNQETNFKVKFTPSTKNMLYGGLIDAKLTSDGMLLPFPLQINVLGNSFDPDSCGWAARYKIESACVILPPCFVHPFHPSHTTFTIFKNGHLPLSYKLHRPDQTNFLIKPSQGLITDEFQIVVVQFHPKNSYEAGYAEKWMVTFNSNDFSLTNSSFIKLQASVECPHIIINDGRDVVFPKVHPGTSCKLKVDFYNPTRFSFWYVEEVMQGESVLMGTPQSGGELWPGEHKQINWTFSPQGVGKLTGLIKCTPLMGHDVKVRPTTVVVHATCELTTLQAVPPSLSFLSILKGYRHERGFELVNNGDALVNCVFSWLPTENCYVGNLEVVFEPETLKLKPGASSLVNVSIVPHIVGSSEIKILFTENGVNARHILPVSINSFFPTIQIDDLRLKNAGPLFSRLDLWKSMQIKKLNKMLELLNQEHDEEVVKVQMPSFVKKSDSVTVELLLTNYSNSGVQINLEKLQLCKCKPIYTNISFSRSVWQDLCSHKTQIDISPMSCNIETQGSVILNLEIHYDTIGYVECKYILSIVPEDYPDITFTLDFVICRTSIPESTPCIDTIEPRDGETFVFNMQPVFIGDIFPFAQGFHCYNNTKYSVSYKVFDCNLYKSPFKYVGDRCAISPMSNHYLLFTFSPSSCGYFEREVDLSMNDFPYKLLLRGTGVSEPTRREIEKVSPKPVQLDILRPIPVYLSKSHLDFGPMKPTCTQKHVIFFNNKTKDIISFKWHSLKMGKVLELRVHPAKGAVEPGKTVECRIVLYSKGRCCDLTVNLTCVFASFTQYSTMVQRMEKYRKDLTTNRDYFTITEKGTEKFELPPAREEWPTKNYLTVSVSIEVQNDSESNRIFLPLAPSTVQSSSESRDPIRETSEDQKMIITTVLESIVWELTDDLCKRSSEVKTKAKEKYVQTSNRNDTKQVLAPVQIVQAAVEDLLYSAWQDVFEMTPRNSTERYRRTLMIQLNSQKPSETSYESPVQYSTMDSVSFRSKRDMK